MSADINVLKGEVMENPDNLDQNVEQLLAGLLNALLREQITARAQVKNEVAHDPS